ncbi:L-rhamnose mutarotase [Mucilaginibacter sp. McL0603]|uniref:L-rhamnose mutarotase n=1 Tax=Mucilaginibacter sp. McL0603 TaxID=3415670 RepID=UPI003CF34503
MERIAFKMKLLPGCAEEYKKRHDKIWPHLVILLKETGISDYSIFLDEETNILFGVLKADKVSEIDKLPQNLIMQEWWEYMDDIMETNADSSPVSTLLKDVFYLP